MSLSTVSPTPPVGARPFKLRRLGAILVTSVLLSSGIGVPTAHGVQPGDWLFDTELAAGTFALSYGVAVEDSTGFVYVTDTQSNKLVKLNSAGEIVTQRGAAGNGFGNFNGPRGVDVDSAGNVYVADTGNSMIQKFDSDLNWMGQWGTAGNANGQFNQPLDVAVDTPGGNIYVADTLNHRIQKFSPDGTWLDKWGSQGNGDGQLNMPRGITVSQYGTVLVADTGNSRVSAFSKTGDALGSFGSLGAELGKFDTPSDVVIDSAGNILVSDLGNDRIQKLNGAGSPLAWWLTPTTAQSLDLDPTTDRAYVASGANSVIAYRPAVAAAFSKGPKSFTTAGKPYSSQVVASGFPDAQFSVSVGALPSGLKLTGDMISGTPRKPGVYKLTLNAENQVEPSATKEYTITVGKASSRLTASWSTTRPRVNKTHLKATIRLSAPATTGLSRTGTIKIYFGSKRVKTVTMYKSYNGTVKVRLPKFKKTGKTKVTVKFLGNSQMKASQVSTYVRVRKG